MDLFSSLMEKLDDKLSEEPGKDSKKGKRGSKTRRKQRAKHTAVDTSEPVATPSSVYATTNVNGSSITESTSVDLAPPHRTSDSSGIHAGEDGDDGAGTGADALCASDPVSGDLHDVGTAETSGTILSTASLPSRTLVTSTPSSGSQPPGAPFSASGLRTASSGSGPARVAKLESDLEDARSEIATLKRVNQELHTELEDMDTRVEDSAAEVARYKEKHAAYEQQIRDAYDESAKAKAVAEKLQKQLSTRSARTMEDMEEEVDEKQHRIDELVAEASAMRSAHATAMMELRSEMRRINGEAEAARADAEAAAVLSRKREDELVSEAAELAASLATAQRALDERVGAAVVEEAETSTAEAEVQLRRETTAAVEARLMEERRVSSKLRHEVSALTQQLSVTRETAHEQRLAVAALRTERDRAVADLEARLRTVTAKSTAVDEKALHSRIATLASSLMDKQGLLDQAKAENSALKNRLDHERSRRREVEASLASASRDREIDEESGITVAPTAMAATPGARRRRLRLSAAPISRLAPIAHNPKVARAADVVDRAFLNAGAFLRNQPVARLLFIAYLVLLHLWALFILAFHTHQLEEGGRTPTPAFANNRQVGPGY